MSITTKELQLIQDNVKMTQNSIKFLEGCAELVTDPQIKSICQQFAQEHQKDVNTLVKHVNPSNLQ